MSDLANCWSYSQPSISSSKSFFCTEKTFCFMDSMTHCLTVFFSRIRFLIVFFFFFCLCFEYNFLHWPIVMRPDFLAIHVRSSEHVLRWLTVFRMSRRFLILRFKFMTTFFVFRTYRFNNFLDIDWFSRIFIKISLSYKSIDRDVLKIWWKETKSENGILTDGINGKTEFFHFSLFAKHSIQFVD